MSPGNVAQMTFFAIFGVGGALIGYKVFSDATDPVRIQEKMLIHQRDNRHRTKPATPEAIAKYYDKNGVRIIISFFFTFKLVS